MWLLCVVMATTLCSAELCYYTGHWNDCTTKGKETVVDIIQKRELWLFRHVCRMSVYRLVKTMIFGVIEDNLHIG